MFEDSLLESGGRLKTKRGRTTTFAIILEIGLIGLMVLMPLIFTEALPKQQLMTFLVAPPPPPPPPPPAAAPVHVVKQIQTDIVNGALRTPTKIPQKIQMIKEDEAPPQMASSRCSRRRSGRHSGRPDGRRDRRHYQFHAGGRAQSRRSAAGTGFGRCHLGSADP